MAFYLARGHKLDDLINSGYLEQLFYVHSREQYYKEEAEKYKAIMGGG